MNILHNLANFFTKKGRKASEKTNLADPYQQAREFEESKIIKSFGKSPLAELEAPALDGIEFRMTVNNLLASKTELFRHITAGEVKAYNMITPAGIYEGSCLAVKRGYGYIYVGVRKKQVFFSDGSDYIFEPTSHFRIYLSPTHEYPRIFAVCHYQHNRIMADVLFEERKGFDDQNCTQIKASRYLPTPVQEILACY